MPKASIIIRTKNEEQWIKHCLTMVHAQTYRDYEVILVDNESQDATVKVAEKCGVTRVTSISAYRPGDALNQGIALSSGDYMICLSAHCVPKDEMWLETLLRGFDNDNIAGVYGRQIPVSFSSDYDKRDLLITFGLDKRVQIKDYFFHNANSAIRKDVWERTPFDAETTNIEDRIWAKSVISQGRHLVYEPDAVVYHHHGIHHDMEPGRARSTVSILESVESAESVNSLPETMRPENARIVAICPVLGDVQSHDGVDLLGELVTQLKSSRYVDSIYLLAENPEVREAAGDLGVGFIQRPESLYPPDKTLEDVLQFALMEIEEHGDYPDAILYANYLFPYRPTGYLDELVVELQIKGLDTVFGGFPDYENYWVESPERGFQMIGEGMKPRASRSPMYRALAGLGCLTLTHRIRQGVVIGERVGIIPITDYQYTYKISSSSATTSGPTTQTDR